MTPLVRTPLYQQLYEELRALADESDYATGSKFLTEREIGIRYGVSRATSNKALASLVSEGVLEFRKGIGTFVKPKRLAYQLDRLISFTEKATSAGQRPSTQVLTLKSVRATLLDQETLHRLRLGANEEAWYLERLRLADERPVILERRYIVKSLCPKLTRAKVQGSLYRLWTDEYQLTITGADESIRAVNLTQEAASLLKVDSGQAGLLVRAIGYLKNDVPLWSEETLYRGDSYEFQNRLGGLDHPGPAIGHLVRNHHPEQE